MKKWQIIFLLMLIVGTVVILRNNSEERKTFHEEEGYIFGTVFHTKYEWKESLQEEIMTELNAVDASLSMFNPNSIISQINRAEDPTVDSLFEEVYLQSRAISEATGGAFDPTVAPLVNAWGFGFKEGTLPDSVTIDSLLQLVGWQKVELRDGHLWKENKDMVLDFSAIAKGYGADRVGKLFAAKGINNYMIEIGGEIVCKGTNPKGEPWKIGINKPNEDNDAADEELQTILALNDCAMATSGNYRNYFVKDGVKYGHTINPKTGRPIQQSILSSTVVAPTCAMADGFATAFMVVGLEEAKSILANHPELKAYFIYADDNGAQQIWSTGGLNEEKP